MKKKYLFSLVITFLLLGKVSIAQRGSTSTNETVVKFNSWEIKKTTQIIFLVTDQYKALALTTDLIKKIEELRTENTTTFLEVSNTCRIKILPKNSINQKDFKPLEEYIIVNKFEN